MLAPTATGQDKPLAREITESARYNLGSLKSYKDLGRSHNDLIKLQWVFLCLQREEGLSNTPHQV